MSYDSLPIELQNVIMSNHSYITKWFVFLTIIFLSCFYIFYVWKNHKQTKYILVAGARVGFFGLSLVYLLASPIMLLSMSPEYNFLAFYTLPLIIYSVFASLGFILFFVDLVRYGIFVLLRLAGLDLKDKNVNEISRQLENSKHFLKYKRYKP